MWKKFLAVMVTLGILSTSAMALTITPGTGTGSLTDYVGNVVVTPDPFNPNSTTATVSFDIGGPADVLIYVIDNTTNLTVGTLSNYENVSTAGTVTDTWTGRVNDDPTGAVLPNGMYSVFAFAYEVGNHSVILDYDYEEVTVDGSAVSGNAPVITGLQASPNSFSALDGQGSFVTFDVNEDADLVVEVRDGSTVVKTFTDYDGDNYLATAYHSIEWNGRDDSNNIVAEGTYTVYVSATDNDGTNTLTTTVDVLTSGGTSSGVIEDFEVNPRVDWDPSDDELEIEFELTADVDDLTVEAIKDGVVIEIMDDNNADDGDYEEFWDGTDEDGDYVDEGLWTIRVTADNDVVSLTVEVDYVTPQIITAFVTKSEIDVEKDEFTNLVFEVDEDAVVTVELYDGSRREATLMDEEEVESDTYYAVLWDGTDDDGDELDEGDYHFKITAENPVDDDIFSTETVDVDIDEDKVSDSKSNATNDFTDPVVFNDEIGGLIEITYCLDQNADVYLAVYDGTSTTGTPEIVLLDYAYQYAGCHTVAWNGKDDKGRDLDEGVNSYKLITKVGSYKDTETGKFVVGEAGEETTSTPPAATYVNPCYYYYWDTNHLSETSELCQAIAWGTEYGIWDGYPDGTFKPYDVINRAEVLKVALETFNVQILPSSGTNEGFSDVKVNAWYMPYVRTAKNYGMFDGYPDGTARLSDQINRVELLKVILEASDRFTPFNLDDNLLAKIYADVDSSNDWYYQYASTSYQYGLYDTVNVDGDEYLYPGNLSYRGDVAILLFRMYNTGLLAMSN